MINFYNYYKHPDLDNNPGYGYELNLLDSWLQNANNMLYINDIEKILHIIKKDAKIAQYVARHIIGSRWYEAEPHILTSPAVSYLYACNVVKGRWPEAEPYIMKDSYYAYRYAQRVIEGRWLEAEEYIKQDVYYWDEYTSHFNMSI